MNKGLIFLAITALLMGCSSNEINTDKVRLETYMDTVSYIIGLDYGIGIKDEKIDVNLKVIFKGLADGLAGESLLLEEDKDAIIEDFNRVLKERIEEEGARMLSQKREEGSLFMQENLKEEGVVELPSGLQYMILKAGKGNKPGLQDSVFVHYRAMFIDRSVFDMSYDRGPAGFRLDEVIPGLSEGIMQMNSGSIYELYIPPALAYGDNSFAGVIPGGSTLIYSIELIEIKKQQ